MKSLFQISILLFFGLIQAQNALYNSGNIRIHPNGNLGFHTNLINDTAFDQNEGLAGFYGDTPIEVQGSISPTFTDVEFMVPNDILLQNSVNVENNVNFVEGNVLTPLANHTIHLNFLDE